LALADGSIAVLTSVPATLFIVDKIHQNVQPFDLYEYFPSLKTTDLNLRMFEVMPNVVCLCSEMNGKIIVVDLNVSCTNILIVCIYFCN
jgi:hypothetical protein